MVFILSEYKPIRQQPVESQAIPFSPNPANFLVNAL